MLRPEAVEMINQQYFREHGSIDMSILDREESDYLTWKIFLESEPLGDKVVRNFKESLERLEIGILINLGDRIPLCQSFLKLKQSA